MLLSTFEVIFFGFVNLHLDDIYHWLHSHRQRIGTPTTINIKERMFMNKIELIKIELRN